MGADPTLAVVNGASDLIITVVVREASLTSVDGPIGVYVGVADVVVMGWCTGDHHREEEDKESISR